MPHSSDWFYFRRSALVLIVLFAATPLGATLLDRAGLPSDASQSAIDRGLLWLLIGGGSCGLKKLRDHLGTETLDGGNKR